MYRSLDPDGHHAPVPAGIGGAAHTGLLPVEAYRRDDSLVMHIDLLGAPPETIALDMTDGLLTLSGRPAVGYSTDALPSVVPTTAALHQEVSIGKNLDGDRMHSRYSDGVLTITVPFAPV